MTPEDYKILKEKADLWDSLSDCLKTQFAAKFPYSETLQNTSNASSHIGLLEEESKEMVYKKESDMTYCVEIKTLTDGKVSLQFSADCGVYGTNELIDEFVISTKELLYILKKHDAEV